MKKYCLTVLLLAIWFLSAGIFVYGYKPLCGDIYFPIGKLAPDNETGKFFFAITTIPTAIIYILTTGPTSETFSDCDFFGPAELETREKLYFLAFSGRHMMQETGRRSGEYADALTEILGCTQTKYNRYKFLEYT